MGPKVERPDEAPPDRAIRSFVRGKRAPRGIKWYGVGSFWGHLQHFIASGIATEDIDSRDWMHPDDPEKLARDIATHLTAGAPRDGASLTEMLGRDLIIDHVSDIGDDSSVSEAVAKLIFRAWELPDPDRDGEHVAIPRGDLLMFGGDTAYPVATANEIQDRLVVPFNRVLASVRMQDEPGTRRALLGVPGNHDWYDGLDGFGRLFRRRIGELAADASEDPQLTPQRESRFEHVVEFVEKFVVGGQIQKQKVLVLDGYVPFQHASYFALPLSPRMDLLAVDRQLRGVDFRQRRYFSTFREHRYGKHMVLMLPDPVYSFLEPSKTGVAMANALELDLDRAPHLVIAGDIHHYQRRTVGASLHVTAGGGGAFLHPARVHREGLAPPQAEWPGVAATRALLWLVPWHVALGRAGFIPHIALFTMFAPTLEVGLRFFGTSTTASVTGGVIAAVVLALVGGARDQPRPKAIRIAFVAMLVGALMGMIPAFMSRGFMSVFAELGFQASARVEGLITLVLATFVGAFLFGAYLALLTALGLESTQAFTCLGHPGFKHFVRLRVRADGRAVDGWVIGVIDPLREDARAVLVDRFTFRP